MEQKRAFLYCRMAHPDPTALELQKEQLMAYAGEQGFSVAGIAAECGSGLDYSRAGLTEALAALGDGEADVLLVSSPCRIGRDIVKNNALLHWLKERGIKIVCADGAELRTVSELFDVLLKEYRTLPQQVH